MKNWRKVFSVFLCLVMCMSLVPTRALAEKEEGMPVETEPGINLAELAAEMPGVFPEEPVYSVEEVSAEVPEDEDVQAEEIISTVEETAPEEAELEAAEEPAEVSANPESWEIEVEEGMVQGFDAESAEEACMFFSPDGVYNLDYPVLEEFILEESGTTVAAGDTVHFKVKCSDANGVTNINLSFGSDSSSARYINLTKNEETGYYEGSFLFQDTSLPGEYYVTRCSATDRYGFYTYYSSNSVRVMQRFCPGSVFLQGDGEPSETPTSEIANFEFQEDGQTLHPGDRLHVSFDIPAGYDANDISVSISRSGQDISMIWYKWADEEEKTLSYDSATGHVSGEYTLTTELKNGRWASIYVYATSDNDSISDYYPGFYFIFTGGIESEVPTITDVTCEENGQTLTDGDTIHVSFRLNTTEEVGYVGVSFPLFDDGNYDSYGSGVSHYKNNTVLSARAVLEEATGLYRAEYTFQEEDVYGVYRVRASAMVGETYLNSNTDILISFAENKSETFTRCEPATNLNWTEDGYTRFTLPVGYTGRYSVYVYKADDPNTMVTARTYIASGDNSWTASKGTDVFTANTSIPAPDSGDYFFTVTVLGDGVNSFDSVTAKSPNFHYTVPGKKLGLATNLTWESTPGEEHSHAAFTMPEDNEYLGGYEHSWYYSKTADDAKVACGMSGFGSFLDGDKKTGTAILPDLLLETFGAGYYYYQVRLLSSNIMECQNGVYSELSPGYYVGQDIESVVSRLEAVETKGKTPEEIKAQVQAIPTEDLKLAMLSNESVVSRLRQLESAAGSATKVNVIDVPVMSSGVRATGAGLNNTIRDGDVTLIIGKPKKEDVLPKMYNNTLAVRFSMELDNVADASSLKVPVLIDLPIPADIDPSLLVLLHYPADGGEPEVLTPTTYLAGEQYYAQFILTGFSDFILTEKINAIFTDVANPDDYFYSAVYWAYRNGVTSGTSATTFSPGKSCTRGQIVTFLWKALGSPEPSFTNNPFTDVKERDYFYKPVLWAKENGVTSGKTATTFEPGSPCTRGQIVTFLWIAKGRPEPTDTGNPFTDVKTSDYFYKPVLWAKENGITSGTSATSFSPGKTCTRAQAMTFLFKACSLPDSGGGTTGFMPDGPVTMIVAYGLGSGTDSTTRILARYAEKYVGQSIIIQNVEGGSGSVGWSQLAAADPDGLTIGVINLPNFCSSISNGLGTYTVRSFAPICNHVTETSIIIVRSDDDRFPDLKALIDYGRKNQGTRNELIASTNGPQASNHIGAQAFANSAGFLYTDIPMGNTADQLMSLLSSEADFSVVKLQDLSGIESYCRILGVFAEERLSELPDVPTLGEMGCFQGWLGSSRCIVAPAGVSAAVIRFYEEAFKLAMEDVDYLKAAEQAGMSSYYKNAAATGTMISQQQAFAESMKDGFWYEY